MDIYIYIYICIYIARYMYCLLFLVILIKDETYFKIYPTLRFYFVKYLHYVQIYTLIYK